MPPGSILYSFQEPALPVHLQRTWGLNSSQVGIVFIGAASTSMLGQFASNGYHQRDKSRLTLRKLLP